MKSWYKERNNSKLLIIFTGWGFGPFDLDFLDAGDNSVLGFYNYTDLSVPESAVRILRRFNEYNPTRSDAVRPALNTETGIHLAAWSFGVWAASRVYSLLPPVQSALAINGTPVGVDDLYGIPSRIFNLTVDSLRPGHLTRFYKRIFAQPDDLNRFLNNQSSIQNHTDEHTILFPPCSALRTDTDRIEELHAIGQQLSEQNQSDGIQSDSTQSNGTQSESLNTRSFPIDLGNLTAVNTPRSDLFTQAIVGRSDQIFPVKNQLSYWNTYRESTTTDSRRPFRLIPIDAPHFPFYCFRSWQQLWDIQ